MQIQDTTSLRELYLENNQITAVPPGIFNGLGALQLVYLNSNDIKKLPPSLFSDQKSALQKVRLQNNAITLVPTGLFDGVSKLYSLKFAGNVLECEISKANPRRLVFPSGNADLWDFYADSGMGQTCMCP